MKLFIVLLLLIVILNNSSKGGEGLSAPNQYVVFGVIAKPASLRAGRKCQLLISLKPVKGIHVNLKPPMEFKFDSSETISSVGQLEIPTSGRTGYLDPSKPVKQTFMLSEKLKPGEAVVHGMLTYFYCSDAEGWCSKFKQPVEITIAVTK